MPLKSLRRAFRPASQDRPWRSANVGDALTEEVLSNAATPGTLEEGLAHDIRAIEALADKNRRLEWVARLRRSGSSTRRSLQRIGALLPTGVAARRALEARTREAAETSAVADVCEEMGAGHTDRSISTRTKWRGKLAVGIIDTGTMATVFAERFNLAYFESVPQAAAVALGLVLTATLVGKEAAERRSHAKVAKLPEGHPVRRLWPDLGSARSDWVTALTAVAGLSGLAVVIAVGFARGNGDPVAVAVVSALAIATFMASAGLDLLHANVVATKVESARRVAHGAQAAMQQASRAKPLSELTALLAVLAGHLEQASQVGAAHHDLGRAEAATRIAVTRHYAGTASDEQLAEGASLIGLPGREGTAELSAVDLSTRSGRGALYHLLPTAREILEPGLDFEEVRSARVEELQQRLGAGPTSSGPTVLAEDEVA